MAASTTEGMVNIGNMT